MSEQQRAFEEYALTGKNWTAPALAKDEHGNYTEFFTKFAYAFWEAAWQTSRASIPQPTSSGGEQ